MKDQSILLQFLGIFHTVQIKNSTLYMYIYWYDPKWSYLRSIFAFADENKEVNVHLQYQ